MLALQQTELFNHLGPLKGRPISPIRPPFPPGPFGLKGPGPGPGLVMGPGKPVGPRLGSPEFPLKKLLFICLLKINYKELIYLDF